MTQDGGEQLSVSSKKNGGRLVVYGDIHGCYDEFISLRDRLNIQSNDIEASVGDFITKGKDSIKTLEFIMNNNIQAVIGNNEDKILRYLRYKNRLEDNSIELDSQAKEIADNLTKRHIDFLQGLTVYLRFKNVTILHGGIQNHINLANLSKKEIHKVLRMRYLDKNGEYLPLNKVHERSIFWADAYDGHEGFIVYGHNCFQEIKKSKFALGIDTGCVYGNKLTAALFENGELLDIYQESKH